MTYRVLHEAPFTATLMRFLGALIMLPFGLALGSAFLFGVPNALSNVCAEAQSDPKTLLVDVPMTLFVSAFCGFLAYALLRHGGASFLDLFGARTTVVGPITSKRTGRTGEASMYYVDVAGLTMTVRKDGYIAAREGMSVRATCGRFERDLTELAEAVP